MTSEASEFIGKLSNKIGVNENILLNVIQFAVCTTISGMIIIGGIFGKNSLFLISSLFLTSLLLSFILFKNCPSKKINNLLLQILLSVICAILATGLFYGIGLTWNDNYQNRLYLGLLLLVPVFSYIIIKVTENIFDCGENFFVLFPLEILLRSPLGPLIKLAYKSLFKITESFNL